MGLQQIYFSLENKMSKSSDSRLNNAKYLFIDGVGENTVTGRQEFKRVFELKM